MPEIEEIIPLVVENELHTCPRCGYRLGFHASFARIAAGGDDPARATRNACRVILICPECGARYDVGWQVELPVPHQRLRNGTDTVDACVPHGSPAACLPVHPLHEKHLPE